MPPSTAPGGASGGPTTRKNAFRKDAGESVLGDHGPRPVPFHEYRILDLLEAEGRIFRQKALRLGIGLALVAMAAVVALIGLGCGVWGAYLYFGNWFAPSGAAALAGLVALVGAGWLLWAARRLVH